MNSLKTSSDWVYCGTLAPSNIILPNGRTCCGMFELTKTIDPLPGCEDALKESAKAFGECIDPNRTYLIKTFFLEADSPQKIIRSARLFAQEALDLFSQCLPISRLPRLMRAGYLANISSPAVIPLLPTPRERAESLMGTIAMLDEGSTHPLEVINRLLSSNPRVFGELGSAIRRGTHWREMACRAEDRGERFLMQWMACETLTRTDEKECLTPKLMASLGFPTGRFYQSLPHAERTALAASAGYAKWRASLNALFDRLREARNHIAHSGYRELEISSFLSEEELKVSRKVMPMTLGRLVRLALVGLALGETSISGLWERYSKCILQHRFLSLADEIDKTIAPTLSEPSPFDEE